MDRELVELVGGLVEGRIWDETDGTALEAMLRRAFRDDLISQIFAELSDECLVRAVQGQVMCQLAFDILLRDRYGVKLFRWFRFWGLQRADAKDAMQEVFLKMWAHQFRTFRFGARANFRAWLYQVAWHVMLDVLRRRRRVPPPTNPPEPTEPRPSALAELIAKELEALILAGLPPDQAYVLQETLNGKTTGEIAAAKGWSKPDVYKLRFQARRHADEMMAKWNPSQAG